MYNKHVCRLICDSSDATMAAVSIRAYQTVVLPWNKVENGVTSGIIQFNLVPKTRENWTNLKLGTIKIFFKNKAISILYQNLVKRCSCHLLNTHNVVTYEAIDRRLHYSHLNYFFGNSWKEITARVRTKIEIYISGQKLLIIEFLTILKSVFCA